MGEEGKKTRRGKRKHQTDGSAEGRDKATMAATEGSPAKKQKEKLDTPETAPEMEVEAKSATMSPDKPSKKKKTKTPKGPTAHLTKWAENFKLENDEEEGEKESRARKEALEYLKLWTDNRDEWKFKKVRQTWLLLHMYDPFKMNKDDFKLLLPYIESLQGRSKQTTFDEAKKIVEEPDLDDGSNNPSLSEDEKKEKEREAKIARNKKKRALQILRAVAVG